MWDEGGMPRWLGIVLLTLVGAGVIGFVYLISVTYLR